MSKAQLRAGRTYTDSLTAVRTVERISQPRPGVDEPPSVIYRELAGRNRGMRHTMPAALFQQFATTLVHPKDVAAACDALGLNAWPIDSETHGLVLEALRHDGIIPASEEHRTRLERMVGHRLATRKGPRLNAEHYLVCAELLDAARGTSARRADLRLAA